jgi:hypothetical protein
MVFRAHYTRNQCRGGFSPVRRVSRPENMKRTGPPVGISLLASPPHHRSFDLFQTYYWALAREMQSQVVSSKAVLVPSSLRQSPFTATKRPAARAVQIECSSSFRERAGKVATAVALSLTLATGGEALEAAGLQLRFCHVLRHMLSCAADLEMVPSPLYLSISAVSPASPSCPTCRRLCAARGRQQARAAARGRLHPRHRRGRLSD